MCMSYIVNCYAYVICNYHIGLILYFTQVNKALARSLGMCLGEDVVVLTGYMLAGPTIFTKLHHTVAMAAT